MHLKLHVDPYVYYANNISQAISSNSNLFAAYWLSIILVFDWRYQARSLMSNPTGMRLMMRKIISDNPISSKMTRIEVKTKNANVR